jgi:hypothetical protein
MRAPDVFVVVPNDLRDAINAQLDAALVGLPQLSEEDRAHLYAQLLDYVDQHGALPTKFTIEKVRP